MDDEVQLIQGISDLTPIDEALRFAKDWDSRELGKANPSVEFQSNSRQLQRIEDHERESGLYRTVEALTADLAGDVLEIGAGIGRLARSLVAVTRTICVLDNNLRPLVEGYDGLPGVQRVVGDAGALPFVDEAYNAVIALNVVDLLESPEAFFAEAARVLGAEGIVVVSTPDPTLGIPDGDRGRMARCISDYGFEVMTVEDDLLWTRRPQPHELQVFTTQVVVARRG